MPPLGKHPHAGLCTATILLRGDSIKHWDNIRDIEETAKSGGVLCLHSAGGIVHSEEAHDEDKDESSFTHILYVWFDPGIHRSQLMFPRIEIFEPCQLPMIQERDMRIRLFMGSYMGRTSPVSTYDADILVLDCHLPPGEEEHVILIPSRMDAAIVFIPRFGGSGYFGGSRTPISELETGMLSATGNFMSVRSASSLSLHFFLLAGKSFSLEERTFLLTGHSGAVLATSEEKARSLMEDFERDPDNFGNFFDEEAWHKKNEELDMSYPEESSPPSLTDIPDFPDPGGRLNVTYDDSE
ncbi:hypothetical protein GUITHDRAFT_119448 [Guillardia theta CCMP2712]|uniref:Pirin N-terminal domain-containing protein n=1 Tax=Guillardia theta (strain CCMP2712) TaxID=905079 RepID=L1IDM7_GUITC|nr:hypothetical protein GUITHDRAFT_119448 [Guillardia theta CCMP2712]EKX34361.1 hypothetical protein GUITHDRAFT_119448 [Guillardia theta CCMP2712]|eukprot:XP_005821341.1 hypothetical protein GUITHDRAFT_119448 [Guillardia theta CCMP2712]